MTDQQRKLSDILKEMAQVLLRRPEEPSEAAMEMALVLANTAWNEGVGLAEARDIFRNVWTAIETRNPKVWKEFKSSDIHTMIGELVRYKKAHFPDDRRRILTCGMMNGKIRVEWIPPVAPGVDSSWEMQLQGLVRIGQNEKAIQFLQETRHLSHKEAEKQVAKIAAGFGLGGLQTVKSKTRRTKGQASKRLHVRLSEGGTDDLPTGTWSPYSAVYWA